MSPDFDLPSQGHPDAAARASKGSDDSWRPSDPPRGDEATRRGEQPTRISGGVPAEPTGEIQAPAIGGYELLEELHRGGQGVVYRALQLGTKRQVALKVLLEGPLASESARRRFEREVEVAASLRHSNIVTILDSGISDGRYYFAMEYIDGLRLDRYLAKVRPTLRETVQLFVTICDAVNFAHQRGVIHRDLKPPNILVDEEGQPHVLDFGLAKPAQRATSEESTIQVLSTAGELLGTVAYMSPEQTLGSLEVDLRSDVYSLGVVFYEALLGRLPYSVDGPLGEVLTRIANAEPQRPRSVRGHSRFGHLVGDELEALPDVRRARPRFPAPVER
jgi:serine/threonine protein kinase